MLLQLRWGEGRIVVCSVPLAFTNHHLLKGGNARFMAGALSLLSPRCWGRAPQTGPPGRQLPMRFILSPTTLRWAWYLTLVLVVVFLVVRARREQRAIPIVLPPRNASRDQVHTVARLYQEKGDHADLARKMTAYFEEELRERTRPGQVGHDDATARHLAIHTGLERTNWNNASRPFAPSATRSVPRRTTCAWTGCCTTSENAYEHPRRHGERNERGGLRTCGTAHRTATGRGRCANRCTAR